MAFVHHQGVCNPRWTSQCGALHLHMETLTMSTVLPSPLGIAFLLNKRCLHFGSKTLFKFYHLEKPFVMSYCAAPAIVPYSGGVPL